MNTNMNANPNVEKVLFSLRLIATLHGVYRVCTKLSALLDIGKNACRPAH